MFSVLELPRLTFPIFERWMLSSFWCPAFAMLELTGLMFARLAFPILERSMFSTFRLQAFAMFEITGLVRLPDRPLVSFRPPRSTANLPLATRSARLALTRRSLCFLALRLDAGGRGNRDFRRADPSASAKRDARPIVGPLVPRFARDVFVDGFRGLFRLDMRRPRPLAAARRFVPIVARLGAVFDLVAGFDRLGRLIRRFGRRLRTIRLDARSFLPAATAAARFRLGRFGRLVERFFAHGIPFPLPGHGLQNQ